MTEMIAFPLWAAAAAAAVLALAVMIAIYRMVGRQALVYAAVALAVVGIGWFALDRGSLGKSEQRRAIEARVQALAAQALAPNSNLACIDAAGGNVVYEACEKSLFASPEQVASALNYVGARLDLLREIAALQGAAYDTLRAPFLRSLETDRFGLFAQVLVERDGCSPQSCYAFDFVKSREHLVANMNERAYETRVGRFASTWSEKPGAGPTLASQPQPQPQPPSQLNINFPSAASIPPISIMSNEPGRPGQNGVEPMAKPEPRAPQVQPPQQQQQPPPRRPAQKAPRTAPQAAPPAAADPFPQPVGSAQQTTGTQQQ